MSFLSRLNLKSICVHENNHGDLEDQHEYHNDSNITKNNTHDNEQFEIDERVMPTPLVVNTNTNLLTDTQAPDTPETACTHVSYGANKFDTDTIVIARGFMAIIHKDNRDIINLHMLRPKDEPIRVAQIMADEELSLKPSKLWKIEKGQAMMVAGVHKLDRSKDLADITYYFLSRLPF